MNDLQEFGLGENTQIITSVGSKHYQFEFLPQNIDIAAQFLENDAKDFEKFLFISPDTISLKSQNEVFVKIRHAEINETGLNIFQKIILLPPKTITSPLYETTSELKISQLKPLITFQKTAKGKAFIDTALITSFSKGHLEQMKLWIDAGADVNATNRKAIPLLQEAVLSGSVKITKLLIDRGADPHNLINADSILTNGIEDADDRKSIEGLLSNRIAKPQTRISPLATKRMCLSNAGRDHGS
ncbi:MAG: hypothetical protein ACJA02_001185 [Myxococcota bacterium]|jgi:hypothetical protein